MEEESKQAEQTIAYIVSLRERLENASPDEAMMMDGLGEWSAYYFYGTLKYDAVSTIKKHAVPTLILQGSADQQVYADVDYAVYQEQLGGENYVEMHLYEGLNHIFNPSEAEDLATAANEYNIAADIPGEVFDDIAA